MSTIRPITIDDTEGVLVGPAATAVLAPASRHDTYQVGDEWFGVGDFDRWQYGRDVQGINLWQRFLFLVADILEIHDLEGKTPQYAEIQGIKMIDCAKITDDDIQLLGYKDRAQWLEQTSGGLGGRHAWLLAIDRLKDELPSNVKTEPVHDIGIISEAGEERIFLDEPGRPRKDETGSPD
jgi:hypothetical protein